MLENRFLLPLEGLHLRNQMMEFLFELEDKYTAGIFAEGKKKKKNKV